MSGERKWGWPTGGHWAKRPHKAGEHREVGRTILGIAAHLLGEYLVALLRITKLFSMFSFRLSSASVACLNCGFLG